MNNLNKELLINYIKSNSAPILVDFIDGDNIPSSVVLSADCEISELNGYYDKMDFVPPKWFNKINFFTPNILVIDKIDSIPKNEQVKFVEILKYRQVSTFELPKDTRIIVTAKEVNKDTINEEIFSLVAYIKG